MYIHTYHIHTLHVASTHAHTASYALPTKLINRGRCLGQGGGYFLWRGERSDSLFNKTRNS